jgi:hypothetical protein
MQKRGKGANGETQAPLEAKSRARAAGRAKTPQKGLKPETRKIAELTPREINPRHHPKEELVDLAASIQAWGFTMPLLIEPDGTVIAGHARLAAAKRVGMTELPCIVATGWTQDQVRAYVIADNRIPMSAEWDEDLLRTELRALEAADFDLGLLGFDAAELGDLLPSSDAGEPTDPEGDPETVTSQRCPTCGRLKVQTKV